MKSVSYFIFCSLLIVSACSKKEDDDVSLMDTGVIPTISIDSGWQVKVKIDGVDYSKVAENVGNGVFNNGIGGYISTDSIIYDYGSGLRDDFSNILDFNLMRNGHRTVNNSLIRSQNFIDFFSRGNYPYTGDGVNGVSIRMIDHNYEFWGTDLGPADQSGSVFTIMQVMPLTNGRIKVYCRFHCTLYNASGQSRVLTNGEYVGSFSPF